MVVKALTEIKEKKFMGMLKEMFGDEGGGEFTKKPAELLAKGSYKSNAETVLSGYKTYQKKYVIKNVVLKMLLVILALVSSIMMLITAEDGTVMPVVLIMICVFCGVYFINEPINNRKKLKSGLSELEGTEYDVEITDQTIKISTVSTLNDETDGNDDDFNEEVSEESDENGENEDTSEESEEAEEQGPPATIIHLDGAVDIIDKEDMFVICVSKKYIFIVPKSTFTEEEVQRTRERLAAVMGVRFITI